ncbi:MAG: signal recognition particle-docking protein FtsY [Desulfobacterales bacterium]|nr:signal recognition particle-docking protein FtsY [Desulfobacterales bacterium]
MAFKWLKRKKDKDASEAEAESPAVDEPSEAEAESPAVDEPSESEAPTEAQDEAAPDLLSLAERVEVHAEDQPPSDDEETTAAPEDDPAGKPRRTLFKRLRSGLTKTRDFLNTDIEDLFSGKRKLDDEMLEELEELLITADIGVRTAMDLIETISRRASKIDGVEGLKSILREEILALIDRAPEDADAAVAKPKVIMVVGVNGVGKTTTIGKLAAHHARAGRKVLIAAADTFRAAAIEQLTIWAERAGADIVKHKDQADPAAVAFDAVEAAVARNADVVLIDTAGRLHTKVNLMEELKKIKRSVGKKIADAPHETLLVLDATTGQNALSQAQLFDDAINLDALALTKLDGTAKGGIVVSICSTLNIPLRHIGVGEKIDDLQAFNARDFVEALI